ncbi:DnaA ATPase domain-containing protein [Marinicella sp. W31]|uniref:DnaA ATPase domain-containing protein n=1 Tax=Marinicella sp. W31 TaxID=3023713 RepID=UPI003757773C
MSQIPLLLAAEREHSFDNFYVGENAAVVTALQYPLKHDFIYLHGEHHVGKSHLVQALSNIYQAQGELVQHVHSNMLSEQSLLDVLPQAVLYVIDGIEDVAGDAAAENGLFKLYNHLHPQQAALLLTSLLPPQSAQWQLPDLISRLNSGQILQLKALRGSQAFELFQSMCEHMGLELSERALNYLQVHSQSAFPQLYQLLIALNQRTLSERKRISIVLLKQLLTELQHG